MQQFELIGNPIHTIILIPAPVPANDASQRLNSSLPPLATEFWMLGRIGDFEAAVGYEMLDKHTTRLRVRYDECDPMGFVHHSNFLKYCEIARTDLFRADGGNYRDFETSGMFVVVVRVDCRYHTPARYDDELDIHVQVSRLTEAKIEQSYRIERAGELIVSATITLAVIDRAGKLQRIPQSLRDPKSTQ